MKFRNGFVSNSSSSSFILKSDGVTLDKKGTVEWLKNPENRNKEILVIGEEMGDGDDIFYLSDSMEEFILEHEERFLNNSSDWTAYPGLESFKLENFSLFSDEEEEEVILNSPYTIRVFKDYSSDSEEDFYSLLQDTSTLGMKGTFCGK